MADQKASAFTVTTTIADTDVFPVITGIGGTPANKIISKSALKTSLALVKADVGLNSADNTSDVDKPVSTAQQTALDAKLGLHAKSDTAGSADTAATLAAGTDRTKLDGIAAGATADVKAIGSEVDTGTDDAKFLTAKAINDSHNVPDVAPGTTGNVLTSDGTDWASTAPAGGGGQTLYTKVVAASGGDYTTLGAALAAASSGWTIFVRDGSYAEPAFDSSTNALSNITIIGESAKNTVLGLTGIFTVNHEGWAFRNIGFSNAAGNYYLNITKERTIVDGCEFFDAGNNQNLVMNGAGNQYPALVTGCRFSSTASSATGNNPRVTLNNYTVFTNNIFEGNASSYYGAVYVTGNSNKVDGNQFFIISNSGTNRFISVEGGQNNSFTNNTFETWAAGGYMVASKGYRTIFIGNTFVGQSTSGGTAIYITAGQQATISGNSFTTLQYGVYVDTDKNAITGNIFYSIGAADIYLNARSNNVISGNMLNGGGTTAINLQGASSTNIIANNITGNGHTTGVLIDVSGATGNTLNNNDSSNAITPLTDNGTDTKINLANGLKSATTLVDVSAATAPTTGQILTAADSSAATWQTPAAGTNYFLYGYTDGTTYTGDYVISAISYPDAVSDVDSVVSGADFTAPATGLYHFEAQIMISGSFSSGCALRLSKNRNAGEVILARGTQIATGNILPYISVHRDTYLTVGDTVSVMLDHENFSNDTGVQAGDIGKNFFTGYRVA